MFRGVVECTGIDMGLQRKSHGGIKGGIHVILCKKQENVKEERETLNTWNATEVRSKRRFHTHPHTRFPKRG